MKRSGTTPTTPNTTACEFGDIVLVPFPFTDQSGSKKRPAAVVSSDAYHRAGRDVVLVAVTSRLGAGRRAIDVEVSGWREAEDGEEFLSWFETSFLSSAEGTR